MTRWSPVTELAGLQRDLDSLFGRMFGELSRTNGSSSVGTFMPAADVMRADDKWMVSLDLPGIDPSKVEIDVVGRTLRVRGERSFEKRDGRVEPMLNELCYGRFEREFTVPEDIDPDKVSATYRAGMLELTLPLKESAKPRRIEVREAAEDRQLAMA